MENTFKINEELAYVKAVKRVKELKKFYSNLTSYCLVIPFLAAINIITDNRYLWFVWPMLGWGIGIAAHAINTFAIGKNWEENKIKEMMEKQSKNKIKL